MTFNYRSPPLSITPIVASLMTCLSHMGCTTNEDLLFLITASCGRLASRKRVCCQCCHTRKIILSLPAIVQLVFVPQNKLFGQLMFVISLTFSCAHDLWFSSFDKGEVQEAIFQQVLGKPSLIKFVFPNHVNAVIFLLLDFRRSEKIERDRGHFSPSDFQVWEIWEGTITERLKSSRAL
ncbi:hypothetical protein BKA82DRAFT_4143565, partial [Pisolithus tinctorius]